MVAPWDPSGEPRSTLLAFSSEDKRRVLRASSRLLTSNRWFLISSLLYLAGGVLDALSSVRSIPHMALEFIGVVSKKGNTFNLPF